MMIRRSDIEHELNIIPDENEQTHVIYWTFTNGMNLLKFDTYPNVVKI